MDGMDRTYASCRVNTFYVKKRMFTGQCSLRRIFREIKERNVLWALVGGVSMDDFINEINSYIEWYNTKRIKQSLGYMSPAEYRHSLGLTA